VKTLITFLFHSEYKSELVIIAFYKTGNNLRNSKIKAYFPNKILHVFLLKKSIISLIKYRANTFYNNLRKLFCKYYKIF